ncbi:MAG: DNA helicase UvrD [Ruminococcaceae bacterium]|nr:DNA helicase UvrD [Oscillospiraceae bacterium]
MDELLSKLNEAQRTAVTATEGYVRVIAGAGSGKTRALSHRFAYLVRTLGILPGNILCVTFTNKSANEMRQRIHRLTGDSDTGWINTFHGFCVSVLREDSHAVNYPASFMVLDNQDINAMLRIIYDERGLTLRDMRFGDARDMIEIQKLFKRPDYYLDMVGDSLAALKEKYDAAESAKDIIFYGYLYLEKKCFALDYNDLIKFSLYIFAFFPEIRRKWQERLEYIMIDEFQDIDQLQYELMEVLCGYHKNLFVVGDPDQTIYTWRGANVKYLLDFDRHFPGTQTVMMTDNYRSTPEILRAANSLIGKNCHRIKKDLRATLPAGEPVRCYHAATQESEAQWIADTIAALHDSGTPYGACAVLYRAHYVTRALEAALQSSEIPFTIYSGVQFYDRAEVKDALSYLRMAVSQDDLSFQRIANTPRRNLGQRRMAFLQEYAAAHGCTLYTALRRTLDDEIFKGTKAAGFVSLIERYSALAGSLSVSELLARLLDESGYELLLRTEGSQERLDNLAELKQSVHDFEISCGEEADPAAYLAHVALYTAGDGAERSDRVKLMTVHAAKGLEFPRVFLCAMNEGIFPSRRVGTPEAMEEERWLAFVALTRAQRALYLSESEGRNLDGSPRFPSRFLLDIDPNALVYDRAMPEGLLQGAWEYIESAAAALRPAGDADILPPGTRVRHSVFGAGTVLEADKDRQAHRIQFDDIATPRAVSFKAKLERLG